MRTGVRLLPAIVLLTAVAAGQTPGKPAAPAMRAFSDAALRLTFSYPAELTPMDAQAASALGERIFFGEDSADENVKGNSASCMKTLLAVGEEGHATARLALFEIDLRCIPPKAAKNRKLMDEVLHGLVAQGNEVLGMVPIDDPVGFLLQGNHAFFASAQGTPVSASALQTDRSEVTATVAAEVESQGGERKILAWYVEASDAALFNRLLACPVAIGAGPAQPLFPAQVR